MLQAGSDAVAAESPRDGFGHLNLARAWEVFKATQGAAPADRAPLVVTGGRALRFEVRPASASATVTFQRAAVVGRVNTPYRLAFRIEYAGASAGAGGGTGGSAGTETGSGTEASGGAEALPEWRRFVDPANAELTSAPTVDVPMHGETFSVPLTLRFDDATWNALPPGDHVALVKGVRTTFAGSRAADISIPVTIVKGHALDESAIDVPELWADQHRVVPIATAPGDESFLYVQPTCNGVRTAVPATGVNGPMVFVDGAATRPHASWTMSTYSGFYAGLSPIRVRAERSVLRLRFVRYGGGGCTGTMGAHVTMRKLGVDVTDRRPDIVASADTTTVNVATSLALRSGPLTEETSRGATWAVEAQRLTLVAERAMLGAKELSFVVPRGAARVRLLTTDPSRLQGLLVSQNADGTIADEVRTDERSGAEAHGGFGSLSGESQGYFLGLELGAVPAGNAVHVHLAGTVNATVEVLFDEDSTAALGIVGRLTGGANLGRSWARGETKVVRHVVTAPTVLTEPILTGVGWTFGVSAPFSVVESVSTRHGEATVEKHTLWRWSDRVAIPLRF
jgi:hypothetical protein